MPLSLRLALVGTVNGTLPDLADFYTAAIRTASPSSPYRASAIGRGTAELLCSQLEESAAEFRVNMTESPASFAEGPAGWLAEPIGRIELHTDDALMHARREALKLANG